MERGVIDRFEAGVAVVEIGGETRDIPRSRLPKEAKPGDIIIVGQDRIRPDADATAARKREIGKLMDDLFE